jgi:hypothetical protein
MTQGNIVSEDGFMYLDENLFQHENGRVVLDLDHVM